MANKNTPKTKDTIKSRQVQRELGQMLEMNDIEFGARVQNERDSNPALDSVVDDGNDVNSITEDGRKSETAAEIQRNDFYDEEEIPPGAMWYPRRGGDGDSPYVPEVVSEITLRDYLLEQVDERGLSGKDKQIADYIIGNLDSNGYLQRSMRSIADDLIFKEDEETEAPEVERVLAIVRQLDPPGIAAFDLRDCLLLQLWRKSGDDARLAYQIVNTCFDDFAHKRYDDIAEKLKVSREDVIQVGKLIRTLNPKPGSAYSSGRSEEHSLQITPDFTVTTNGDTLHVELNNRIPELTIAESYERQNAEYDRRPPVSSQAKEQMRIVRDGYNRAKGFLKLCEMRKTTLFACMREICRRQREYFFTGDTADLKPLTLKQIADAVDRDVSVISRAVANKYVDTPWGIKPLRFFFSEGINGVSTTEIKDALRRLVDDEDKHNPYTDAQLCDLLKQQGYDVARRTIGKYRAADGIPMASMRKEVH